MSTTIRIGLDNSTDGYQCGQNIARQALSQLNKPIALALLFTSHPRPDLVLRGVNHILGSVPLIGATSMGEYSAEGYVEEGAGLMLIASENLEMHPVGHRWTRFSQRIVGKMQGISATGLGNFQHRALMLFPDNRSVNLDNLVQKAMSETAMMYDILGGPAPRVPAIFYGNKIFTSGIAGAELLSQEPLGLALANGWETISGPYRVTKIDSQYIVTLDGRPVYEIYEDFFASPSALDSLDIGRFPLGICDEGDCKVTMAMQGFNRNGALRVSNPPPLGSLVHILTTKDDQMINACRRAIHQSLQRLHTTQVAGALFIDCMSTNMILGDTYPQQRRAVHESLGDAPFLGFRSHGIIARLQGQISGHYECSVASCVFPT